MAAIFKLMLSGSRRGSNVCFGVFGGRETRGGRMNPVFPRRQSGEAIAAVRVGGGRFLCAGCIGYGYRRTNNRSTKFIADLTTQTCSALCKDRGREGDNQHSSRQTG